MFCSAMICSVSFCAIMSYTLTCRTKIKRFIQCFTVQRTTALRHTPQHACHTREHINFACTNTRANTTTRIATFDRTGAQRAAHACRIHRAHATDRRLPGAAPDELELFRFRSCRQMTRRDALAHARRCLVPFERQLFFWQRLVNLFYATHGLHTQRTVTRTAHMLQRRAL